MVIYDGIELTPAQEKAIERIKASAARRTNEPENREFKRFEVKPMREGMAQGPIFVLATYGMKNDENTAASLFCRDRGHFSVGVRGGIRVVGERYLAERKNLPISKLREHPLIFGWES